MVEPAAQGDSSVAQLVEHRAVRRDVVSSGPTVRVLKITEEEALHVQLHFHMVRLRSIFKCLKTFSTDKP